MLPRRAPPTIPAPPPLPWPPVRPLEWSVASADWWDRFLRRCKEGTERARTDDAPREQARAMLAATRRELERKAKIDAGFNL